MNSIYLNWKAAQSVPATWTGLWRRIWASTWECTPALEPIWTPLLLRTKMTFGILITLRSSVDLRDPECENPSRVRIGYCSRQCAHLGFGICEAEILFLLLCFIAFYFFLFFLLIFPVGISEQLGWKRRGDDGWHVTVRVGTWDVRFTVRWIWGCVCVSEPGRDMAVDTVDLSAFGNTITILTFFTSFLSLRGHTIKVWDFNHFLFSKLHFTASTVG